MIEIPRTVGLIQPGVELAHVELKIVEDGIQNSNHVQLPYNI